MKKYPRIVSFKEGISIVVPNRAIPTLSRHDLSVVHNPVRLKSISMVHLQQTKRSDERTSASANHGQSSGGSTRVGSRTAGCAADRAGRRAGSVRGR
jgi:hypothetical protein